MKLTADEEYGLRCLLQVGRQWPTGVLTIPAVSRREGISVPHAGKVLQMLRQGGLVTSARGQAGGYTLSRPPEDILLLDVLAALGGRLYEEEFCRSHKGAVRICTHSTDCSIRSLWQTVQSAVDSVLGRTTLRDLLRREGEMSSFLGGGEQAAGPEPRLVVLPVVQDR